MGGLFARPRHPAPVGKFSIGSLRDRLPSADGSDKPGLFAQVHYPIVPDSDPVPGHSCSWFRDEVLQAIGTGYNVSPRLLHALAGGISGLDPAKSPLSASTGLGNERWPIVVFSSGLWGCCEMYTQFCRDLASCGAIVVALEHEDGSGIYARSAENDEVIAYQKPPSSGSIVEFRHPFLEKRVQELTNSTQAIRRAATGPNPSEAEDDDKVGTPSPLLKQVLAGGDPDQLLLVGHSFGSASILRFLRRVGEKGSPQPYQGLLLMDLWPAPLTEEDLTQQLNVPYAIMMSEHWVEDDGYLESHKKLIDCNPNHLLLGASVVGTTHQWISDSQLMGPGWILRKMGILGPLPWHRVYGATAKMCQLTMGALLGPEGREELPQHCVAIDEDVIELQFQRN